MKIKSLLALVTAGNAAAQVKGKTPFFHHAGPFSIPLTEAPSDYYHSVAQSIVLSYCITFCLLSTVRQGNG